MLSETKNRFLGSVKFRLTLLSGCIIALTTLAAFLLLYGHLAHALQANVDHDLAAELSEFQSIYRQGGLEALRREVALEESAKGKSHVFVRMFDTAGAEVVNSDLTYWNSPAIEPPGNGASGSPVFATIDLPERRIKARSIYGMLHPDLWVFMGVDAQHDSIILATYRQRCMEVFAVSLLVSLLAAWLIAGRAMRGVHALTTVAEEIAGGDIDRRITTTGYGNGIDRLAWVLNTMMSRIAALIKETKALNDSIAHELRSPLTRIRGMAEMAITSGATLEKHRETAAEVVEACDELLGMVNSMLTISEIESGVVGLDAKPADFALLVADTCELFQPAAEDRKIVLNTAVNGPAKLLADNSRLQQVVANLLDNALKYTPSGGTINVKLTNKGNEVVLAVEDTGMGICESDIPHIFERFYRTEQSRSTPGNGLGLGLVRGIVNMHGGRVEVKSVAGRGSIFRVYLPCLQ